MKVFALLISVLLIYSNNSFAIGTFDVGKYIEQCGGKIYPQCDSEELNQLTIYKEAEAKAIKENKLVLVIVGADWCPPCRTLNKALKANPEGVAQLEEQFVIVELSGDTRKTKSSRDLTNYLKTIIPGFPTMLKVDPVENKAGMVHLSSYSDIEAIKDSVFEARADSDLLERAKDIQFIDNIPMSAFDVPVDLEEKFGQYPYFKSKPGLIWKEESEADKFINAGLARFNLFHYIDAARCFKQALAVESDNGLAKALLAMAYVNLGWGQDIGILSNVLLSEIDMNGLSNTKRVWIQFAKAYVYGKVGKIVQDPYNKTLLEAFETLEEALGSDDLEVLTLATYLAKGAKSPDSFNKAAKVMPEHAGAYHYLVHHHENSLGYYFAEDAANKLVALAEDSAHAQHMLGHIAPRLKKWKLAEEQFLKASKIHTEWAKKYNFPESFDWHYSHNMDLMGSVYVGLGEMEKAMDLFVKSCDYDWRACYAGLKLGAYMDSQKGFDKMFAIYGTGVMDSESYKHRFAILKIETDLASTQDVAEKNAMLNSIALIPEDEIEGVEKLIQQVAKSYLAGEPLKLDIENNVTLYAEDRLGCASFDGWGKGMLDLMRLIKFSKSLGYDQIEKDVNAILDQGLGIEFNPGNPGGVSAQ